VGNVLYALERLRCACAKRRYRLKKKDKDPGMTRTHDLWQSIFQQSLIQFQNKRAGGQKKGGALEQLTTSRIELGDYQP